MRADAYLDAHGPRLEAVFDEALQAVLAAQPIDPVAFLASHLSTSSTTSASEQQLSVARAALAEATQLAEANYESGCLAETRAAERSRTCSTVVACPSSRRCTC